ncbi:MAG: helix-turn-helix transcriptional regulator [Ruminococcaceae bacterium]|nr:helix-turn-helix transcriptional regulator [Oscillospiraceae bacterium]
MHINNVGYHYKHKNGFEIKRPYGSGDFMMLLLRTSALFHFANGDEVAPANSVIVYSRGTPQNYGINEEYFSNDWIHFDMTEGDVRMLSEMGIVFDEIIPVGDIKELSQIVKSMYQEKYGTNPFKERTLELYFELLCIKISEKIKYAGEIRSSPNYVKLSSVRTWIYNHPEKNVRVKELAKMATISESYFMHLYKRFFGVSVVNDTINSKIEHGKFLLSSTGMTVCAISYECGYKNDVLFMRQFKTVTGMTPSEYRKHHCVSENERKLSENVPPYSLGET